MRHCKVWAVLLGVLIAGCTHHEASAPPPSSVAAVPPGARLVVLDKSSNVLTMDPQGQNARTVAGGAGRAKSYRQPAWSPDGASLAYVALTPRRGSTQSELVVTHADGREVRRVRTEQPPFYLFWRPDSTAIAYLSSAVAPAVGGRPPQPTMGLSLCPVDGDAHPAQLALGSPFYFAWSPNGQQVLVHTSEKQLGVVDVAAQKEQAATGAPAPFAAPGWSATQDRLIYPVQRADGNHLVLRTPGTTDDQSERDLLDYEGAISFVANPKQPRVAVSLSPARMGLASFGTLYVDDYATEMPTLATVDPGPVLACWWSPDGQRLLYLVADVTAPERVTPTQFAAPPQAWTTWRVWDGQNSTTLARFIPSPTFLGEYLRYADQYAQSMTLWSPDSTSFCYAGRGEDGQDGIWVQGIAAGSAPKRVADGVYAAWSPR